MLEDHGVSKWLLFAYTEAIWKCFILVSYQGEIGNIFRVGHGVRQGRTQSMYDFCIDSEN